MNTTTPLSKKAHNLVSLTTQLVYSNMTIADPR